MLISQLITELAASLNEHGDLSVKIAPGTDIQSTDDEDIGGICAIVEQEGAPPVYVTLCNPALFASLD